MTATAPKPVFETQVVHTRDVACDGSGGALGHPRVFLHVGPDGEVACPYCSRLFVLEGDGGAGH